MSKHLEILKKLVSFQTENNPIENHYPDRKILDYINEEIFKLLKYETFFFEENDYFSFIAYLKRKRPTILFIGHCDVVPPGPGWISDPYELTISENKAYGRGAADMKGAVSVMISLAEHFSQSTDASIIYAINLDEESGGQHGAGKIMENLEKHSLYPDFVINGDANGLQIVNRRRNPYAISFELEKVKKKIKGIKHKKTFRTEIAGERTMHAAYFMRDLDVHCADSASDFLRENSFLVCNLEGVFVKNNVLPQAINVEYIIPDKDCSESHEYDENLTNFLYSVASFKEVDIPSGPSDYGINLTFNYYREKKNSHLCQMDLRIMSRNVDQITEYFEHFIDENTLKCGLEVRGSIGPVHTPIETELIQKCIKVAKEMNLSTKPIEMGGATDSRWFSHLGIPTIEFGPLGGNVHGSNEYVEISSLEIVSKFYQKLVKELCM